MIFMRIVFWKKKNIIINCNSTYLYNFFVYFKNFVLIQQKKKNFLKKKNYYFFNFFFKKYFILKIKKNCFIKITTNSIKFKTNKYFQWISFLLKKHNFLFKFNKLYIKNIIYYIYILMYKKDLTIFSNWLKFLFENTYYKNHKILINLLKTIIYFFNKYLKHYLQLKGLRLNLKGKIALSGSSKKKKISIWIGKCSLTKKKNLLNFTKNYIKTLSGVLGFSVFVFF